MKWLAPAAVVALAMLAEVTLGRVAGGPDFALFFGRFHPLVVHLPIGFFLLVAMGEAATFVPKLRDRVEPALGLLVPVSAVAALGAFLMGQLLALEGGFPAGALGWHRRLTLMAIMGMAVCWVLFDRLRTQASDGLAPPSGSRLRWAYRGVMGLTLGLLSLGAHFGGTMTRGESYLSKYAPAPLKPLLGSPEAKKAVAEAEKPAAPSADPLVYQDVLQPILKQHCVECHGADKQKGKLRLDSLEALLKGGENGPVVVAGNAKKSPLLARILLPATDDDHMPPEGKASPKPEALALIEFWIERGALPTLKVRDVLAPAASRALLEHALGDVPASDSVPVSAPGSAAEAAPAAAPAASDATAAATSPAAAAAAKEPASAKAHDAPTAASSGTEAAPAAGGAAVTAAVATEAAPTASGGATSGPGFLAAHCVKCHGAAKQKGKLRVDSTAAMLQGGANGAALVPGSPDQSSVVKRVRLALGNDEHMPPGKEPQPTATEIAMFAAWVRSGTGSGAARAPSAAVAGKSTPTSPSGSVASAATQPSNGAATTAEPAGAPAPADAAAPVTAKAPVAVDDPHVSGPADPAVLQSLPPQVALFSSAVQPLFREKCGKCHIKDKPAGGLMIDQQAQLLEGGFSGAGIVPKDRKSSFVMQRLVLPPADDDHMPPSGEPVLSADEVELVGAWIDQGAPAAGLLETAKLTAGAARALSARGVKGTGPQPIAVQAGGCGACSVPGAPQPKWLGLQALALLGACGVLSLRRQQRRA